MDIINFQGINTSKLLINKEEINLDTVKGSWDGSDYSEVQQNNAYVLTSAVQGASIGDIVIINEEKNGFNNISNGDSGLGSDTIKGNWITETLPHAKIIEQEANTSFISDSQIEIVPGDWNSYYKTEQKGDLSTGFKYKFSSTNYLEYYEIEFGLKEQSYIDSGVYFYIGYDGNKAYLRFGEGVQAQEDSYINVDDNETIIFSAYQDKSTSTIYGSIINESTEEEVHLQMKIAQSHLDEYDLKDISKQDLRIDSVRHLVSMDSQTITSLGFEGRSLDSLEQNNAYWVIGDDLSPVQKNLDIIVVTPDGKDFRNITSGGSSDSGSKESSKAEYLEDTWIFVESPEFDGRFFIVTEDTEFTLGNMDTDDVISFRVQNLSESVLFYTPESNPIMDLYDNPRLVQNGIAECIFNGQFWTIRGDFQEIEN